MQFREFTRFRKPKSALSSCFQYGAIGDSPAFFFTSRIRHGMFRIHRTANGEVAFTLSGRLDKQHSAELEAVIGAEGKDRRITLDLKDLTLTGQEGITFLAQCEMAGIALVNCDPYVREWITRQKANRSGR